MNKRLTILILTILMSAVFLSSCTGGQAASSWPGVTLAKDTIYVSEAGSVFAVRLSDGVLTWRYPEKPDSAKNYYAAPTLFGDQLLVGDYAGTLHSLDIATGTERWNFPDAKGHWIANPLVVDDTILAPSADRNLYALDKAGKLRWKFTTNEAIWAKPASDGKTIFLPSMDHFLYALRIGDGSKIWSTDLGGAIVYSPALDSKGILYAGTLANELIALDSATGRIVWRFKTSSAIWSSPTLYEDNVFIGDFAGMIYCINSQDGRMIWKLDSGGPITAGGAVYPDGIIFVNETGNVLGLSFKGEKQWTKIITGKLYSTPVVAEDCVIIGITGSDNLLMALDFKGSEKWSFALPK